VASGTIIEPVKLARLIARLDKAEREFSDTLTPHKQIGIAVYGTAIRAFDKQGRVSGWQKWAPLAESTKKQKRKLGKSKPLVRTGTLRAGFDWEATRANVRLHNDVEYAKYHQDGTVRIPARQLLPSREVFLGIAVKIYEARARKVAGDAA
jgi:hypothetical protein